jgi:hypothetical protein
MGSRRGLSEGCVSVLFQRVTEGGTRPFGYGLRSGAVLPLRVGITLLIDAAEGRIVSGNQSRLSM